MAAAHEAREQAAEGNAPQPPLSCGAAPPARRPRRRALLRAAGIGIVCCGLALAGGFVWFTGRVPTEEIKLDRSADGIVVLTGGASRVADAIELLATGHGRRLLITGVHHATRWDEISRLLPEHDRFLRCCVDLDRSAVNTLGNAVQARRWAEQRGFRSLIVVTSNYHMPRAMAELAHQLPAADLIPFPVVTEKIKGEPWWHADKARLLLSEYVKYIYAVTRMHLDPDAAPESGRISDPPFSLLHLSGRRSHS